MVGIPMKRSRGDEFDTTINSMANYLMLLSRGNTNMDSYQDDSVSRVFECKTCNRQFPSFQALGGHRASHKKPKLVDGDHHDITALLTKPKTHKCSICGLEFAIGQALGGHMRRHRAATTTTENHDSLSLDLSTQVVKKVNSRRVFSLDLNLTPLENDFEFRVDDEKGIAKRASKLDARIADVRRDMDNDLYPHMLIAIAGRRWVIGHGLRLAIYKCARSVECRSTMGKVISMAINKGIQQGLEAGIVHGKGGRSLAQLEAYDPEVEGKYVAAVSEFENILFPLLDELESLKDSPLASIMSALVLKDDQGNVDAAPEFARFQPSLDQVVVPVNSDSSYVDHEMLLSEAIPSVRRSAERKGLCPPPSTGTSGYVPPPGSSLDVADYQVLSDDGGSAAHPPIVQAHDDLFDTSVLDGASA
ncbi:putative gypsy type transposase [Tanacetum coccineum]